MIHSTRSPVPLYGFSALPALADCKQLCIEFTSPARISHALAKAHRTPPINKRGAVSSRARWVREESPRANAPGKYGIGLTRKSEEPETANPALGGILSRRFYAFDGAGRCYLALGHLTFIRSGGRSKDPCNPPCGSRLGARQQ